MVKIKVKLNVFYEIKWTLWWIWAKYVRKFQK